MCVGVRWIDRIIRVQGSPRKEQELPEKGRAKADVVFWDGGEGGGIFPKKLFQRIDHFEKSEFEEISARRVEAIHPVLAEYGGYVGIRHEVSTNHDTLGDSRVVQRKGLLLNDDAAARQIEEILDVLPCFQRRNR